MLISILAIYFVGFYFVGILYKNNGYIDIGWGLGFVVIALTKTVQLQFLLPTMILTLMILLWGLRLTYHLWKRNVGKAEDYRYKAMRERWGKTVHIQAFFKIYLLQAVFMYVVALPVIYQSSNLRGLSVIGILFYITGILFETVGDYQLKQHIKNYPGTLMTRGLWSLTRHPNYFGDALVWTGIGLFSVINGASPWVLIGPMFIIFLLRFVSGVPLLEQKMKNKAGWNEYAEQVPAFIPKLKK